MHKEAEETQMIQETQTKKSPSIMVIALGLICIILAASTIAAFILNTPDTTELDKKDKKIDELNTQIVNLTSQIAVLLANQTQNNDQTATINSLNAKIADLNEKINAANASADEWRKIATLEMSHAIYNDTLIQKAGQTHIIYQETLKYAGYIVIEATSNSTNTCFIELSYTYGNTVFEKTVTLAKAGEKVSITWPILPAALKIGIGNRNNEVTSEDGSEVTIYDNKVTTLITYHY